MSDAAASAPRPRSPLWMVILALACEEPMHPYRMQTLIKQRGKDQIANVAQRYSVYQTIDALKRAGLIAVRETERDERRPERTIYEATDEGRRALQAWVRTGLSTIAREYPEFPAALATLYGIRSVDDLSELLEMRITAQQARLADLEKPAPGVPRLFLLDAEYQAAIVRAEIRWLRGVIAEVASGRLAFPTLDEMLHVASQAGGPSEQAIRRFGSEMGAATAPPSKAAPEGRGQRAARGKRSAKKAASPRPPRRRRH